MPVTPEVQTVLDAIATIGGPPSEELTPEEVRQAYRMLSAAESKPEMEEVTDRAIPGPAGDIPVRVYVPTDDPGPRPALVYLHGGGWVIGDLETHDGVARKLATASEVTVVSVDYRLAPEHPFPAAVDDALAAVRWVAESANAASWGIDPARLMVGGDSAGGNLAAVAAQQLRDEVSGLRFQLLVYPAVDMAMAHPSVEENGDGYFLTKAEMHWFRHHYLGDDWEAWVADPRVSPLVAADEALRGVAPALVITAECDPLRDEGEAYAVRLQGVGVEAKASRYDGMIHGFFAMGDVVPDGKGAIEEAAEALRTAVA